MPNEPRDARSLSGSYESTDLFELIVIERNGELGRRHTVCHTMPHSRAVKGAWHRLDIDPSKDAENKRLSQEIASAPSLCIDRFALKTPDSDRSPLVCDVSAWTLDKVAGEYGSDRRD